jgi:hypothetical protein
MALIFPPGGLQLTGGTLTGPLTINQNTDAVHFLVKGSAGQNASIARITDQSGAGGFAVDNLGRVTITQISDTASISGVLRLKTAAGSGGAFDDVFDIVDNANTAIWTLDGGNNFTSTGPMTASAFTTAGAVSAATLNASGLTASKAVATDGSKNLVSSATSATELGYVSGVTSAIQTQLGARLPLAGGTMTGAILCASGTVSAPGLSFSAQTNNGLYSTNGIGSTKALNCAVNGVQFMSFDHYTGGGAPLIYAMQRFLLNDGSAGTPSLSFFGEASLGFYRSTVGVMTAQVGGADKLSISATALSSASNVAVTTAGQGFQVKEGSNAKMGTAVLVGGTVTVANTSVTASSRIFLTADAPGGTLGSVYVSARTAGTSFTITSTSAIDTSTVAWIIFEPS